MATELWSDRRRAAKNQMLRSVRLCITPFHAKLFETEARLSAKNTGLIPGTALSILLSSSVSDSSSQNHIASHTACLRLLSIIYRLSKEPTQASDFGRYYSQQVLSRWSLESWPYSNSCHFLKTYLVRLLPPDNQP